MKATVEKALKCKKPEDSEDSELIDAMDFVLNVAFPSVDPTVLRPHLWAKHHLNHVEFFKKTWNFEFATAMVLLVWFSDLENIRHNIMRATTSKSQDNQNSPDPDPQVAPPEKKRRKKMQTRKNEVEMEACYFSALALVTSLQKEEGFLERLKAWDHVCCKTRSDKAKSNQPTARTNTVPLALRSEINPLEAAFTRNFFAGLDFPGWETISTGTNSPLSTSTGNSPAPLTQQSPNAQNSSNQPVVEL